MSDHDDNFFLKILEKVKSVRNLDFSGYRDAILKRRVMMRVRLTKSDNFEDYFNYLDRHQDELDKLMDALTINVTEFFRDAKVFDTIETKLLPVIFKNKSDHGAKSVKIWSCGSSSGEEAYSLLILISEFLGTKFDDYQIKIVGTDIDERSLKKASEGVYEAIQFKNLSPVRRSLIDKYFYDMGNGRFWIREKWPRYVEFRFHDVVTEPPLASVDLVVCRNMLIYFDRELQDRVIEKFHSVLNAGGFMILGNVESVGQRLRDNFFEFDRAARIYEKV